MCYMCDEAAERRKTEEAEKAKREAEAPRRILTRETVEDYDPCWTFSTRFEERFPEQVEVTVELAVSQALDWDWHWAADRLLSPNGYDAWSRISLQAEDDYDAAIEPYSKLLTAAYDEADRVYSNTRYSTLSRAKADEAYQATLEIPRAAGDAAREIANRRWQEARAKAWAEIYISEGKQDSTND
jgi:hypothetical protein